MTSPLGLKFSVVKCIACDAFYYRVISKLIPFLLDKCSDVLYNSILLEVLVILKEGFMWPRIGWSVTELPGIDGCEPIQYGMINAFLLLLAPGFQAIFYRMTCYCENIIL